jgi:transcriptional regulator with XRE-family HTH domain
MKKKHPLADVLIGLSIKEIARRARVDESTARRWKRGEIVPSAGILLVLDGDLGAFDPAWEGWVIRGGKLITPERSFSVTPGRVRGLEIQWAQVKAYQRETLMLRAELEELQGRAPWLDEQPQPDDIASSQLKLTKI